LRRQFADWVEESRAHDEAYGETVDGRARFDLEPGHSADKPALRRINAPTDVSESYYQVMRDSKMTDCVAELIGPNIKYHHSKVNSKLPGAATVVKWHQDFPFTPHSNDDLITALLMVDEVTEENGPLQVVPGSHKGQIYDLWHDGVFTGAVDDAVTAWCLENAVTCTGKAGSLCLMHTRLLHGSAVLGRGRGALFAQSGAEPSPGRSGARPGQRAYPQHRVRHPDAANAEGRLVLRPAGAGLTGCNRSGTEKYCLGGNYRSKAIPGIMNECSGFQLTS
jgi:hypothetical protein